MKPYILFTFFVLCSILTQAQSYRDTLFQHHTLSHPKLKTFDIHVTKSSSVQKRPLILYLDGSGTYPIFYQNKAGRFSTSVPLDVRRYSKDYYVALISKPGTPFKDSLRYTTSGRAYYPESELYKTLYSLDWRAEAASEAIDYLLKKITD